MTSRRAFLTSALGAGAAFVVGGCASESATVAPTSDSPGTTSPATTTPTTTTSVVTPVTTAPTTTPPVVPWAGADFSELDRFLEAANTNAFRVVEGGEVIHEWYRDDETFARDVASAQKSVLSLLVGRAIGDGSVTLDTEIDEVLGVGWTPHGQSAGITVGHLLAMTSGLDDQLAVVAAPATMWLYSGAFAALLDVLTTVTGRELNDLAADWLFDPAGAGAAQFYERRTAQAAPIGLFARASDLTAIGQSVLDATQPGLPSGWIDDSYGPSQSINEAYGYLWWLNGQDSFRLPGARMSRPGALIPSAPPDLAAALGKDDQKLYVSRDLDLVVARLGDKASPEVLPALSTFDDPLWALLLDLRAA
jgi:CubicO group peptidase (beta-lactamase class C family)